jgi:hypothetical protein
MLSPTLSFNVGSAIILKALWRLRICSRNSLSRTTARSRGAQPHPDQTPNLEQLAFFDRLAAITREPDAAFKELRALYANDDRLRAPETVFNAALNRSEAI